MLLFIVILENVLWLDSSFRWNDGLKLNDGFNLSNGFNLSDGLKLNSNVLSFEKFSL